MTLFNQIWRDEAAKGIDTDTPLATMEGIFIDAAGVMKRAALPDLGLVVRETIEGAAKQNHVITLPNLKSFRLAFNIANDFNGATNYEVFINGDTTAGNYHRNGFQSMNGGASASFEASSSLLLTAPGIDDTLRCVLDFMIGNNKAMAACSIHARDTDTALTTRFMTLIYNGIVPTDFSSVQINSNRANGVGLGSEFAWSAI